MKEGSPELEMRLRLIKPAYIHAEMVYNQDMLPKCEL
jgi:hypothetical protein